MKIAMCFLVPLSFVLKESSKWELQLVRWVLRSSLFCDWKAVVLLAVKRFSGIAPSVLRDVQKRERKNRCYESYHGEKIRETKWRHMKCIIRWDLTTSRTIVEETDKRSHFVRCTITIAKPDKTHDATNWLRFLYLNSTQSTAATMVACCHGSNAREAFKQQARLQLFNRNHIEQLRAFS